MAKYKIKHPGLYLRVNDTLQAVEVGTKIEMSKEKGDGMVKRGYAEALVETEQEPEPVKEIKKPKKRKSKSKKKED